jgi:nucleoside-diphosphate-sugar epimerase
VLNIGGGVQASMTDIIRELGRLTGKRVPVDRQAAQIGDVRRTAGDTGRARDSLGWRPRVSLRDGLRSELDWVRERREAELEVVPTDIALIAGRAS